MTDLALAALTAATALGGLAYPAYVARLLWLTVRTW